MSAMNDEKSEVSEAMPLDGEPAAAGPSLAGDEPETKAPLSAEQVEELKAKAARADEHWDRLLRTTADLVRYAVRNNLIQP